MSQTSCHTWTTPPQKVSVIHYSIWSDAETKEGGLRTAVASALLLVHLWQSQHIDLYIDLDLDVLFHRVSAPHKLINQAPSPFRLRTLK